MRATAHANPAPMTVTVPLLDSSDLPAFDDWALLGALNGDAREDAGTDFDRFGQFNVAASFDD